MIDNSDFFFFFPLTRQKKVVLITASTFWEMLSASSFVSNPYIISIKLKQIYSDKIWSQR